MSDHRMVEFDGTQYRIGRFTAKTGSFILNQFLPKLIPFMKGEFQFDMAGVAFILPTIGETEFSAIQDHAMSVVSKMQENGAPSPVFANGRWADKALEFNSPAVYALTANALIFNLEPFFAGGGLQKIMASLADSIR